MATVTVVDRLDRRLLAAAVVVGLAVLAMTYVVFASPPAPETSTKAVLPAYNYQAWHSLPVQQGRTQPFESFCSETMRQVVGRNKFEGKDPVAVVVCWMMLQGNKPGPEFTDWETHPFILCDHYGLREKIYEHLAKDGAVLTEQQRRGKYISPADLRQSPGFDELLKAAAVERKKDNEKAHFRLSAAQLKAEDVARRLELYDEISGKSSSRLLVNAMVNDMFFDLQEKAEIEDSSPEQVLANLEMRLRKQADPLHLVVLDRVPESAWFSIGELRACTKDPNKWRDIMEERLGEMPQLYISPECLQALKEFQAHVQAGQGQKDVDDLGNLLKKRREDQIEIFKEALQNDKTRAGQILQELLKSDKDQNRLIGARDKAQQEGKNPDEAIANEVNAIVQEEDDRTLKHLQEGLDLTKTRHYRPEDPEFRMMHLGYLESRYPDLYKKALDAQPFPDRQADQVLTGYAALQKAYRSGDAGQFDQASQAFFQTLHDTSDWTLIEGLAERNKTPAIDGASEKVKRARESGDATQVVPAKAEFFAAARQAGAQFRPYPGISTIPLELLFNKVQPFMWAWIIMLGAVLALVAAMSLDSRIAYVLGFALFFGSLAFQLFGFFTRVYISGRAPVSNMYETVIWVSFMSGIFSLVLELIYRRKVILLGGALLAFFGLVLADQMPLALDPKISPLLPVLRSNYWLTVHVLTIVSSYAGGSLAWVLGNLTLVLLVFGKGSKETLKTLSQFTYRAIQIAVLLLAAGTFLGGWWAAESWGRFWGWDSKEVGALIALVAYVIPLHARFIGWVKDFGLAVSAVLCYAFILFSWYVVNFVIAAGLHAYGFGAGGGVWMAWIALINLEWVIIASMIYQAKVQKPVEEEVLV